MKKQTKILASILLLATTTMGNVQATELGTISNFIGFGDSWNFATGGYNKSYIGLLDHCYGTPANEAGVTNFAVGSATGSGGNYDILTTQVANYLNTVNGKADPNAIYSMYSTNPNFWENDINAGFMTRFTDKQLQDWGNGDDSVITKQVIDDLLLANITNPIRDYFQQLTDAGAEHFLMPTVFNDAYRQGAPNNMARNRITKEVNAKIEEVVAEFPNANIVFFNNGKLDEEIALNPAKFLPKNELAKLYHNLGLAVTSGLPSAFDSSSHPSEYVHEITKQLAVATMQAPSYVSYARELALTTGNNFVHNLQTNASRIALNAGQINATDGCGAGDMACNDSISAGVGADFVGFLGGNKQHFAFTNGPKLKLKYGKAVNVYTYANYDISNDATIGLHIMGSHTRAKLGHSGAVTTYHVSEYLVGVNGAYQLANLTGCPAYLFGGAGVGQIQYRIKRHIQLGLHHRHELGKPIGLHYLANIGAGYNFACDFGCGDPINISPFLSLSYQNISMKKYSEKYCEDPTSSTMKFKIPRRKSLVAEVGATVAMKEINVMDCAKLTPSITLSYGRELMKHDKKVYGAIVEKNRYFWTHAYESNKDHFGINGQLTTKIDKGEFGIRAGTNLAKNIKTYSIGLFAGFKL